MKHNYKTRNRKAQLTGWRPPRSPKPIRWWRYIFFALLSLIVGTGAILTARYIEYRSAGKEYASYQETMRLHAMLSPKDAPPVLEQAVPLEAAAVPLAAPLTTPPDTAAPAIAPTVPPFYSGMVAQLQNENRDAVGWIDIIHTGIQYPLMQHSNNAYYMTRTFQKKTNASGAIFLDCWNAPGFTDFNTVIYGHNMSDGSMFAGLREYRHQAFFNAHPFIEITLLTKKLRYRVFAAYVSRGMEDEDFRGQDALTEEQRAAFIKAARKRSTEIASNFTVSRHDRLLTLVTCTGGKHPWFWVVHAALVGEEG